MILNLGTNHLEYWKTWERDGYIFGFRWFPTFPPTRRLRFPWGRNKVVRMGWETRWDKEVTEEAKTPWSFWSLDSGKKIPLDWYDFFYRGVDTPSRHFDKEGNEIA